jgi:rhodanese-related sulfurtransferase
MMAFLMGLKSISPTDLNTLVAAKRVAVFDVNSAGSYAKAHVPGARNLDAEGYRSEDLPADKASSLVFYCSNPLCRKAPIAAKRAKQMGYGDVRVLSAGISGWVSSGLPTEAA